MSGYCVITAMRDAGEFVAPYRRMVENFGAAPTAVVIGENDSADDTLERLRAWPGIRLLSFRTGVPRFPRTATAARSAHLAMVRNRVVEEALRLPWRWALMQDLQKWSPPDLPARLMALDLDVVAPAVRRVGGFFYDTWCFRDLDGTVLQRVLPGSGVREVSAVGGVYLVRREVFAAGCRLAGGGAETCDSVPFCRAARERGYRVWLDGSLSALHCARPAEMQRLSK